MSNLTDAIKLIEDSIIEPKQGINNEEIFLFLTRLTPMISIDLLIKNDYLYNKTLLSWRDDEYCGTGWHLPGGVIRLGETWDDRIKRIFEIELYNIPFKYLEKPINTIQMIVPNQKNRSHTLALLFECYVPQHYHIINKVKPQEAGYLEWHITCPNNLIKCHEVYKGYI
jgi:hypothetical protein